MFEFLSNDPLISLLRSFGFNTVRLPRASIKPLQLFINKNNQFYQLGSIQSVFISRGNAELPNIAEDEKVTNFSGKKSGDLSIGVGISILNGILSAFGAKTLGIDSQYKQAKTVSYQYEDVLQDSIEIAKLDQYLTDADINPLSKCIGDLLEADQVYVTASTIKSCKFTILPEAEKGAKIDIRVPEIQKIVGVNVTVSGNEKNSAVITFEGKIPLVFGFQAWQLFYNKGKLTRTKPVQKATLGGKLTSKNAPPLITGSPFLNLAD